MSAAPRLHVLLLTRGSHGDALPYLALGRELRRRGHDATLMANGRYAAAAARAGLEFVALGSAAEWDAVARDPDHWHPRRGFRLVARTQGRWFVRRAFEEIAARHEAGRTVVAAQSLVFGARVAEEALGVPVAMLHLSPMVLRSLELPPVRASGRRWPRAPRPLAAAAAWTADRLFLDRVFGPPTFALRRELGLPPARRLFHHWMTAGRCNVAWWPEWFAPPRPDWPRDLLFAGFPFDDGDEGAGVGAQLAAWIAEGAPPVAVTPGSVNARGAALVGAAIAACERAGRRALVLSPFAEVMPAGADGARVRREAYAPFGDLLPRCAAIIHHGGLGTAARAMRASIPQVVVPVAFDNPDNAWWLRRLGAAEVVPADRADARRLAVALGRALSADPAPRGARARDLMAAPDPFARVAERLERLAVGA